jgi:hypothetical protein
MFGIISENSNINIKGVQSETGQALITAIKQSNVNLQEVSGNGFNYIVNTLLNSEVTVDKETVDLNETKFFKNSTNSLVNFPTPNYCDYDKGCTGGELQQKLFSSANGDTLNDEYEDNVYTSLSSLWSSVFVNDGGETSGYFWSDELTEQLNNVEFKSRYIITDYSSLALKTKLKINFADFANLNKEDMIWENNALFPKLNLLNRNLPITNGYNVTFSFENANLSNDINLQTLIIKNLAKAPEKNEESYEDVVFKADANKNGEYDEYTITKIPAEPGKSYDFELTKFLDGNITFKNINGIAIFNGISMTFKDINTLIFDKFKFVDVKFNFENVKHIVFKNCVFTEINKFFGNNFNVDFGYFDSKSEWIASPFLSNNIKNVLVNFENSSNASYTRVSIKNGNNIETNVNFTTNLEKLNNKSIKISIHNLSGDEASASVGDSYSGTIINHTHKYLSFQADDTKSELPPTKIPTVGTTGDSRFQINQYYYSDTIGGARIPTLINMAIGQTCGWAQRKVNGEWLPKVPYGFYELTADEQDITRIYLNPNNVAYNNLLALVINSAQNIDVNTARTFKLPPMNPIFTSSNFRIINIIKYNYTVILR